MDKEIHNRDRNCFSHFFDGEPIVLLPVFIRMNTEGRLHYSQLNYVQLKTAQDVVITHTGSKKVIACKLMREGSHLSLYLIPQ